MNAHYNNMMILILLIGYGYFLSMLQLHVSAVYAILFASLVGFGIAVGINSLVMMIFAWRTRAVTTEMNSNLVWFWREALAVCLVITIKIRAHAQAVLHIQLRKFILRWYGHFRIVQARELDDWYEVITSRTSLGCHMFDPIVYQKEKWTKWIVNGFDNLLILLNCDWATSTIGLGIKCTTWFPYANAFVFHIVHHLFRACTSIL